MSEQDECDHIYFKIPIPREALSFARWAINNFKYCPYCTAEMEKGQLKDE